MPMILGLIADGNRRWAKLQGIPTKEGHWAGFRAVSDEIFPACYEDSQCTGIAIYAFSTENWKRSLFEVKNLMEIYNKMCEEWRGLFQEKKVRLRWCGRRSRIPSFLRKRIECLEEETAKFDGFTVYLCLDYGGRDEILRAVDKGGKNFEKFLEVPDLDIFVRPGGEKRLSNFCLWQVAYAELFFLKKFLPEITRSDIQETLNAFALRDRRKGGDSRK